MKTSTGAQSYAIVVSDPPNQYEQWVEHVGMTSDIGELCTRLLGGIGTLIDVGAAIGWVSLPVAKSGSRVIAIEMNPLNCLKLHHASRANGFTDFTLVQTAASDHDGILHFEGEAAWGHISHGPEGKEVLCQRLDSIMCDYDVVGPVVMKVDVENHEHVVFRGASASIRILDPIVIFEAIEVEGDDPNSYSRLAKQIIADMGYSLFLLYRNVLVPKRIGDLQEGHVSDFVALSAKRLNELTLTGYEVRALSDEETLDRFKADVDSPDVGHQAHVRGLINRWKSIAPALAQRADQILQGAIRGRASVP